MDEQRAVPRNRLLKAGTIEFDGGAVNCMVRNVSIFGAALDVSGPVGIPEHFMLAFRADGLHMPCHVVWRKDKRIGVAFD
jgi:PilZ domain